MSDDNGDYVGYYIPRKIPLLLEQDINNENEQFLMFF